MNKTLKNVLYILFIMIMLGALAVVFLNDRQRDEQNAEENRKLSDQTEQANVQARLDGTEILTDLAAMLTDVDSTAFVCWGDDELCGNGQYGLPDALVKKANDGLFSQIRNDFAKIQILDTGGLSINVANMGVSGESTLEIMARSGATKIELGEDFRIPPGLDKKQVLLIDEDGDRLHFVEQEEDRFGIVTIGGVPGNLYCNNDVSGGSVTLFARSSEGKSEEVDKYEEIFTEGADKYVERCPILFLSEEDDLSAGRFVSRLNSIIEKYGEGKYYAVVCTTAEDSLYDNALKSEFGDKYIRNDKAASKMSSSEFDELAAKVYSSLDAQGAFDKIKTAVNSAEKSLKELK